MSRNIKNQKLMNLNGNNKSNYLLLQLAAPVYDF